MAIRMPTQEDTEKALARQQASRAQALVDEAKAKIDSGGGDATVWFQLAAGHMGLQDWDSARRVLEQATEIDERFGHGWANLALAYRETGKHDLAVDCARRSLEITPRNSTAQLSLGLALVELGRSREAIDILRKVLLVQKNQPLAIVGLIEAYRQVGDVDEVQKLTEEARMAGIRIV
ncbi:MAG: tetratricopeptide repeat protein [bacterium]